MMGLKRSLEEESGVQTDLFGLVEGVGARHIETTAHPGGGGYLDECTLSVFKEMVKKSRDKISLADLEDALPGHWYEVARLIGVSSFLDMWMLLIEKFETEKIHVKITIPNKSKLQRICRNNLIFEHSNREDFQASDIYSTCRRAGMSACSLRSVQRVLLTQKHNQSTTRE